MFPLLLAVAAVGSAVDARAVNLSSVWLLPEEGYPVFYRYFRDRITWYEAEAVCQFHHGQLLTVDSGNEFDAARAYLKELDVSHFVWTGLRRAAPNDKFLWPENKGMEHEGYWLKEIPKTNDAVCAAIDPASDFRWQPLPCSGPQAAAFICQMEVPRWAVNDCLVSSLPSLTVTFLPEQGAVELLSDCGFEGTRRIACKGHSNRDEMVKQLSCQTSTEATVSSSRDSSWDEQPTRHRRESQVTPDMEHIEPTTRPLFQQDEAVVTSDPTTEVPSTITTPATAANVDQSATTVKDAPGVTTVAVLSSTKTPEVSSSKKPEAVAVPDSETVMPSPSADGYNKADAQVHKAEVAIQREEARRNSLNKMANHLDGDESRQSDQKFQGAAQVPLEGVASLVSETGASAKRTVLVSSKPIPPSLGGNSPFLVAENVTDPEPEKDSHESFNESPTEEEPGVAGGTGVRRNGTTTGPASPAPVSVSETMEESGEVHPEGNTTAEGIELPERPPNRGRLLVHPQHRSFYPYFLNRVLG